jgi:hypothetical protein
LSIEKISKRKKIFVQWRSNWRHTKPV